MPILNVQPGDRFRLVNCYPAYLDRLATATTTLNSNSVCILEVDGLDDAVRGSVENLLRVEVPDRLPLDLGDVAGPLEPRTRYAFRSTMSYDYCFEGAEALHRYHTRDEDQQRRVIRFNEWQRARNAARSRLTAGLADDGRKWRHGDLYDAFKKMPGPAAREVRAARKAWKAAGKAAARAVAILRNEASSDVAKYTAVEQLAQANRRIGARNPRVAEAVQRYNEMPTRLWVGTLPLTFEEGLRNPRPASDPTKVAYYRSFANWLNGLRTVMRPGRYLQQFHGDKLDEKQIKSMAEAHVAEYGPQTVRYIESDDPDGWEWVYEHGHGFTSCMVYDRDERYLHCDLYGPDHPVRAYAYAGNGLRLAYLGDEYKGPGTRGRVFARAIVYDPALDKFNEAGTGARRKGCVRVYGDGRLYEALRTEGYDNTAYAEGVRLHKRKAPFDDDCYIVPYLDGVDGLEDCGGYFVIGGDDACADSSEGLIRLDDGSKTSCACCGDRYHIDDMYYSEVHETDVCAGCADREYRWVQYNSCGDMTYVHQDDCVQIGDDWYHEDRYLLDRLGFVQCDDCGRWCHQDDITEVVGGDQVCGCRDVVKLDREYDGFHYARRSEAQMVYDESGVRVWLHEDDMDDVGEEDGPYHHEEVQHDTATEHSAAAA